MKNVKSLISIIGPGILVAATGVGAGDLATATFTGTRLGTAVLWAVVAGAALKYLLNEGLTRWQLATETTLLEGCVTHFGRFVQWFFAAYLVVWSYLVAMALMSACGVAAHAMLPLFDDPVTGKISSNKPAAIVATAPRQPRASIKAVVRGGKIPPPAAAPRAANPKARPRLRTNQLATTVAVAKEPNRAEPPATAVTKSSPTCQKAVACESNAKPIDVTRMPLIMMARAEPRSSARPSQGATAPWTRVSSVRPRVTARREASNSATSGFRKAP